MDTTQPGRRNLTVVSLVSISLIGLIVASMLIFFTSAAQDLPWRRPIISSTYALICILGAVTVFFPKKCSRIINPENWHTASEILQKDSQLDPKKTTIIFGFKLTHGHHPNCEGFYDHEFQVGNKTFCAGCTGLLIGALVSLVTVSAYFSSQVQIDKIAIPLIGFGSITVLIGLLTPVFIAVRSALRLAVNALFILGMSSILVGADTLLHNIQIDVYLISLDVLWLTTRISVSQLSHEKICANCAQKCIP